MRYLISVIVIFFSLQVNSQDCEIYTNATEPVCPESLVVLSVEFSDTLKYYWSPDGDTIANLQKYPEVTTEYKVEVFYNNVMICTDSVTIEVRPKIDLEFEQLQLTCPGLEDCQGQVRAIASGAFEPDEYHYIWEVPFIDPSDSSLALGLCGDRTYYISVKDDFGCVRDDSYKVKSFLAPVIEMHADPEEKVYLQNPYVNFTFENLSADTLALTNWVWDFGENPKFTSTQADPLHKYLAARDTIVRLNVTDVNGCDTTYTMPYDIKPVNLFLTNAFTPNDDQVNDLFVITGEDDRTDPMPINHYYLSNELTIFNRYGKEVYKTQNYENDWDGGNLPEGVYFYVLRCVGEYRIDEFKSSLTILK